MKKVMVVLIALTTVMICVSISANAKVKIGAGGEFGLNIATAVSDQADWDEDKKSRTGLLFGGIVNFGFSDYISLQPEIRYSMKGVKWEGNQYVVQNQNYGKYKLIMKTDYMEIPVYLKFSIPTGTLFTPDFLFGPVIGIKLSSKYELKLTDQNYNEKGTNSDTKSLDFGLGFGGGGRFTAGPGDAFFQLVYNLGLSNVSDGSASVKTRTLSLVGGYIFNFGK